MMYLKPAAPNIFLHQVFKKGNEQWSYVDGGKWNSGSVSK